MAGHRQEPVGRVRPAGPGLPSYWLRHWGPIRRPERGRACRQRWPLDCSVGRAGPHRRHDRNRGGTRPAARWPPTWAAVAGRLPAGPYAQGRSTWRCGS